MKRFVYAFGIFAMLMVATMQHSYAQCTSTNVAFNAGEKLTYKLKFNWKFVWMNVGSAEFSISSTNYKGQDCYKASLITRGNKTADKLFVMRDTLTSITTRQLTPLYYRKGAKEGSRSYLDEAWYSYLDGRPHVKQTYTRYKTDKNPTEVKTVENESAKCFYDMVSMMLNARSFDATNFKVGDKIKFPMVDNGKVKEETLVYRGKKTFKMDDSNIKYRCLVFSFVEYKSGKEKEVITFYITDDKNHLPVRLDMFLKFGSAKAFMTSASGVRNPQTSIVSK